MSGPKRIGEGLGDLSRIHQQIAKRKQAASVPNDQAPPETLPTAPPSSLETPLEPIPTPTAKPVPKGRIAARVAVAQLAGSTLPEPFSPWYYSPELIQCCLPHSDPKTRDWIKKNGNLSLIVSSGVDINGQPYGVPYGAFPRLMLAYIITRVFETRERRIQLTSHFGAFLKEIGYTGNLRGDTRAAKSIKNQILRLLRSSISFQYEDDTKGRKRNAAASINISSKYDLWWDFDKEDQDSLFGSWIEVTEDFYNSIIGHPVPLNIEIIKDLGKDTLAIDLYMFLTYRLFTMQAKGERQIEISYNSLQGQFGSNYTGDNYRKFRQRLREAMVKLAGHTDEAGIWHPGLWRIEHQKPAASPLEYHFTDKGLILHSSPPSVGRRTKTQQQDATAILAARSFSSEVRNRARLLAPHWSIDYLEKQYFEWVDSSGIPPREPIKHFLGFVREHVKRNGTHP